MMIFDIKDHIIASYAYSDIKDTAIIRGLKALHADVFLVNTEVFAQELRKPLGDDGKVHLPEPDISWITPIKAAKEADFYFNPAVYPVTECIDRYMQTNEHLNNHTDIWGFQNLREELYSMIRDAHEETGYDYDLSEVKKRLDVFNRPNTYGVFQLNNDYENVVNHRPIKFNEKFMKGQTAAGDCFEFGIYKVERDQENPSSLNIIFRYIDHDHTCGQTQYIEIPYDTKENTTAPFLKVQPLFDDFDLDVVKYIRNWINNDGLKKSNIITNLNQITVSDEIKEYLSDNKSLEKVNKKANHL